MARVIQAPPIIQFDATYDIDTLSYKIVASLDDGENLYIYRAVPEKYEGSVGDRTFAVRHKEDLQPLMDALWNLGVRPNAYTITNEHFNSVKEHLGDMKTLVEKAYKLEFPKEKE